MWATIARLERTFGLMGANGKKGRDQFFVNRKSRMGESVEGAWLRARKSYQLVGHRVSEGVVGC